MSNNTHVRHQMRGLRNRAVNAITEQLVAHNMRLQFALNAGEDTDALNRDIGKLLRKRIELRTAAFNALNDSPALRKAIDDLKPPIDAAKFEAERLAETAEAINKFSKSAAAVISLATTVVGLIV